MPELNNIETHTRISRENLDSTIAKIRETALYVPAANRETFEAWLNTIQYPPDENADLGWQSPEFKINEFTVFATLSFWLPIHYPELKESWLSYNLHFETELITCPNNRGYVSAAARVLKDVFWSMTNISTDFPTFLTNEADGGRIWFQSVGFERTGLPYEMFDLAFLSSSCPFDRFVLLKGNKTIQTDQGLLVVNPNRFNIESEYFT